MALGRQVMHVLIADPVLPSQVPKAELVVLPTAEEVAERQEQHHCLPSFPVCVRDDCAARSILRCSVDLGHEGSGQEPKRFPWESDIKYVEPAAPN